MSPRGSVFLSRVANYFPSRFLGFAFLDVPYNPPGVQFDVEAINKSTTESLGYPIYGYWPFFLDADAGEILNTHVSAPSFRHPSFTH